MTVRNVIADATNLALVPENELGSFSPPPSGWFNVDENTLTGSGSKLKYEARAPISKNLQLRKGMITGEDSGFSIDIDVTKWFFDKFAGAIWRCAPKHSGGTGQSYWQVSDITSNGFTVPADGGLAQHMLVYVRGADNEENNGLFEVESGSSGTNIKVSGLTVETPSGNCTIEVAGYRFTSGDLQLDSNGDLITTTKDLTTLGLNNEQGIVIGGRDSSHSFATSDFAGAAFIDGTITTHKIPLGRRNWLVEQKAFLDLGTLADNLDTVVEAKTAGTGGNSVTVAAVADGTPAAKAEKALNAGGLTAHIDTVVRAKTAGAAGNSITIEIVAGAPTAAGTITEVGTHVKIAIKTTATASTVADFEALITGSSTLLEVKTAGTGATSLTSSDVVGSFALASGTDATAPSVGESGSAVTLHFTPGFTTVAQLEAVITSSSTLVEVKHAGTPSNVLVSPNDVFSATALASGNSGADVGTGKTVEVYFTRWYRNVPINDADFLVTSFAGELTYPGLFDGSDGYVYMFGNVLDSVKLNIPSEGKITATLTFVGTRSLKPTSSRKTGPASALDTNARVGHARATEGQGRRVAKVDETGVATDFETMGVTIMNHVSAQKSLGHRGARLINQGDHEVNFESDVILTSHDIIDVVLDNDTVTADTLMRNEDCGALLDLQALTLGTADPKIEKNKSVTISTKGTGFQKRLSTSSLSMFAYLPPLPEEDQ